MRRSTSEPAAEGATQHATGSTAGLQTGTTASGYGHLTRSRPQDSANFLQTHDRGPAGFVALSPIRQSSTWEVAPRARGLRTLKANGPGGSIRAGPVAIPATALSSQNGLAVGLTTAPLPGTAQAVGGQGRLIDLCRAMSAIPPISSALPPATDVAGTLGDGLKLTRRRHFA